GGDRDPSRHRGNTHIHSHTVFPRGSCAGGVWQCVIAWNSQARVRIISATDSIGRTVQRDGKPDFLLPAFRLYGACCGWNGAWFCGKCGVPPASWGGSCVRMLFSGLVCCVAFGGGWASVVDAANDPIAEKIERERKTLEALKDKIEEKRKR